MFPWELGSLGNCQHCLTNGLGSGSQCLATWTQYGCVGAFRYGYDGIPAVMEGILRLTPNAHSHWTAQLQR